MADDVKNRYPYHQRVKQLATLTGLKCQFYSRVLLNATGISCIF